MRRERRMCESILRATLSSSLSRFPLLFLINFSFFIFSLRATPFPVPDEVNLFRDGVLPGALGLIDVVLHIIPR